MRNACQENRCLKWTALRRAKIDSGSAQWISITFVETANLIAVVTAISDLHPRTECPNRRKLLDCEADSFGCGVEPSIVDRMAPPALWNEQLCGCVVVDLHIRQIVRSSSLSLRLVDASYAILKIPALRRQALHDFEDIAARPATTEAG